MKKVKLTVAAIVVVAGVFSLYGCMTRSIEREMNYLASAMTKLSAAVDAKVRYEDFPASGSSEELLRAVANDNPQLMKNFDGRVLSVLREGEDSAVLLCEPGPGRPLLEDAGCTARLDVHRWSTPGSQSCEFTLKVKSVCGS